MIRYGILLIAALVRIADACCPYFDSAEWKMKQRLFQEYAHGETNDKCLGYTESFKWHPSHDSNYCYMMAFRFWCRAECTKTCGDPAHYPPQGWVTCRGKDCNNNWYPTVYCECLYGTGSCNTGIVMWTVVEQFYYAHCLSHLSIQQYALLATLSGVSRQYMTGPLYDQMYPHAQPPSVQHIQVQPGPVQRIQVQPNPVQQKPQIQPPPVQQRPPARPPAIVPRPPVAPPPVAHPPPPQPPPPAHPHITPPPVAKKIVQPPPPAPKPVKQPEPMKPKAYVTPPLYKHAPIKTPSPYAGIKPKAPLVMPHKPIPAAPKIVKKPLPQPPKLQRVYVKPPQVKQPKCVYWQSNDWKAKASQFTAFVSGTTKQQCTTENEAVQWAPDAAEGSRCNELGLAVKHFCIAKCRTDCQVQLAPASAAAKPKCLAKGCEIACLCNTWCQTERTPWAEVENKYKLECLGALCPYLQTKMWQDNLKSYTAAAGAAGTSTGLMPQCSADIAAVRKQWEDPANNDQCKELGPVIQYWCLKQCIATCGNPSTYGGAKLSCASMTKCDQNGYPFSYCKCKPGCETGATSAQQIEERFRMDCLPKKTEIVVPAGQCKYFETADWMAKKDQFFSYRQQFHSEQCFNEQKGLAWSSTPNAANYKGCDQLGFVVKYWCAKQCKAKCPQALQAAASLACEITTCEGPRKLPLMFCHCTPACQTTPAGWIEIQQDFTVNCLKSNEDLQCPYMKTQEWQTNQLRFTQFVTGTTRQECQTELQGILFDLSTADNNQCGILGISVKHWCYRKCNSTCGPPSKSADAHIRCLNTGCVEGYPVVSCECTKTCQIANTPWPMITSQYTADCLGVKVILPDITISIGGMNCGYFSTSAWKDKKTMFKEYIKFITKDDCYKSISAAEFAASNTTSVAAGATVSAVGACEKLGLAAKYWCLRACEADCPGDHSSGIDCASDKCDGKYPTLTCKCSASCQSKGQTWTAIETKYEKECINDPTSNHWQQNISNNVFVYLPSAPPPGQITIQKQECPYLSQAGVSGKLQTYNANSKCASVVSGAKFAPDGQNSECNKLGLVAKNWCYRNCKELFGDPALYKSPIRCVTEGCIDDYPLVACHCKPGTKTDGSSFLMLETRFQEDCTAQPKESPKKEEARKRTLCPYFSTDAWLDNRIMFTQRLARLTQDSCYYELNGIAWDLASAESLCKTLGQSIKHWCHQQCTDACGDPRTYESDNKIGCISKECDADGNAMMVCKCTKDCSTQVTSWQTIEATYEKDCLEGPQACQVCDSKNTFELSVTLAVGGENNVTPALAPPGVRGRIISALPDGIML